jgi:hypothetical protein
VRLVEEEDRAAEHRVHRLEAVVAAGNRRLAHAQQLEGRRERIELVALRGG